MENLESLNMPSLQMSSTHVFFPCARFFRHALLTCVVFSAGDGIRGEEPSRSSATAHLNAHIWGTKPDPLPPVPLLERETEESMEECHTKIHTLVDLLNHDHYEIRRMAYDQLFHFFVTHPMAVEHRNACGKLLSENKDIGLERELSLQRIRHAMNLMHPPCISLPDFIREVHDQHENEVLTPSDPEFPFDCHDIMWIPGRNCFINQ